ncbi:MAG: helix-turn-helix transcriptional regulator [Mycobacteriaceae bacterium]
MGSTEQTSLDAALGSVGPRLRALRQRTDTTLDELAATTGISASTLSRLESGKRRPTLELLLPLARAHGVALDDLVDAPSTGDPRVHLRAVQRHGMTILPLTQRAGGVQAYKMIIPGRTGPQSPDPRTHEGYEWLYILDGRLRLLLGDRELVLLPGEAAELDTRTPHWMGPSDERPVELLALFGRQGERAHLRARPVVTGDAGPAGEGEDT